MKAMILAAGRGERMRPLTDALPKPLLHAGGKPLIQWQIERLADAGFRDLVINHAHLGYMIEAVLGDGGRYGVRLAYSAEPEAALETAGGIAHALPLLGDAPFLVVNGDVFMDIDLAPVADGLRDADLAHLVLVPNPPHHPAGDFGLDHGRVTAAGPKFTFSGVGVYRRELFVGIVRGSRAALGPLLRDAVGAGRVSGELFSGQWMDVGTPERLAHLDHQLSQLA